MSVCQPYLPLSPYPLSSVMRRWMVLCHSPGSSEGRRSVWGKCQSLTGGGGGREAGWKMSSFTGKSCEPHNVSSSSSSSNTPSPPSLSVGALCVCVCAWGVRVRRKKLGGGGRSYSADFHPCKKKRRPLPVRRSRHKIKEGKLKWEESEHRGKEEKHYQVGD